MRRCSRCWPAARRVTQPESTSHDAGKADTGESAHFRALERLYLSAPINQFFPSRLIIDEAGHSRIEFSLDENFYHAAGAVHGTSYFKMLDDAAFYAANSLVSDRFLLTTAFNLRSEEHTSELQSLMRISYAVFCLKKKNKEQENYRYSSMIQHS